MKSKISAQPNGTLQWNRDKVQDWEHFTVEKVNDKFAFRSHHGKYMSAQPQGDLEVNRASAGAWEFFTVVNVQWLLLYYSDRIWSEDLSFMLFSMGSFNDLSDLYQIRRIFDSLRSENEPIAESLSTIFFWIWVHKVLFVWWIWHHYQSYQSGIIIRSFGCKESQY